MTSNLVIGGSRDRRDVVKAGAGVLAAMVAGTGLVSDAAAQEATPPAAGGRDLNGFFGITRSYTVAEDADVQALIEKVLGFVEIISAVPGFASYVILYNDETRVWTAVSIFDNAESAQASTDAAAEYVEANDLGGFFVDPSPAVVEGTVIINAGY